MTGGLPPQKSPANRERWQRRCSALRSMPWPAPVGLNLKGPICASFSSRFSSAISRRSWLRPACWSRARFRHPHDISPDKSVVGFRFPLHTSSRRTLFMIKATVTAAEAAGPYNTYDSMLEIPSGTDPNQNAWLTLQLRIKLNFADSKNQVAGLTVNQGGTWYAKDTDGYLFPLLDWPAHLIARFQREFVQVSQRTWNYQYVLITPM